MVLALALASCGGESSSSTTSSSPPSAEEEWPVGEVGEKVSVPGGPPPKKLVIKDLAKGNGPAAKPGDEVEFEYVEAIYSTGEVLSVAVPGAPFRLKLGSRSSLPGWERGIGGMKVGGRRELIIPPHLGYGEQGSPPSVPPNSTLLLQVALVGIK
jgi:peptidylprolyl isomerase